MIDWDDVGSIVVVLLVLIIAVLGVSALVADHHVDGYYVSHGGQSGPALCVYAHWTWHPDEVAFCTDDMNKALDFAARANAMVKP